ncbi:MAG: 1-deoxy-D-xylulose-5-phosphate synthase, partial [Bacteroidetes bacterium]
AGLVGEDGATHHGIFDITYLICIPNLIIFAPRNEVELRNILFTAQLGLEGPIAIRYPRGRGSILDWELPFQRIEIGKGLKLKDGDDIALLTIGTMAANASAAISQVEKTSAKKIAHYDLRFVKPLDEDLLHEIFRKHRVVITVEDGVIKGGFGSAITQFASENNYTNNLTLLGVPDVFPQHGTVSQLQEIVGLSSEKIAQTLQKYI